MKEELTETQKLIAGGIRPKHHRPYMEGDTNSCPACGRPYTGGRYCAPCVHSGEGYNYDGPHNTNGGWMSSEL